MACGLLLCSGLWYTLYYGGIGIALLKLYLKLTTGWCRSQACLVGKTAIVTGANTGIGYETAIDFAKRGARVILACRNEEKAKSAVDRIIRETDNPNVLYKLVDFASLKSVRSFAEDVNKTEPRLDILVNNAGAAALEDTRTEDGLLTGMQSNYYGPFLLTVLLLELLKKTESSRVINVSSIVAKYATLDVDTVDQFDSDVKDYCRSKLCNVLFTIKLARRLAGTKVTTYSLHPGVIHTELARRMPNPFKIIWNFFMKHLFKNAIEGAQTSIHCAIQEGIEQYSGEHFEDCKVVTRYETARDPSIQRKLWEKTENFVKLDKSL